MGRLLGPYEQAVRRSDATFSPRHGEPVEFVIELEPPAEMLARYGDRPGAFFACRHDGRQSGLCFTQTERMNEVDSWNAGLVRTNVQAFVNRARDLPATAYPLGSAKDLDD